MGNYHCGKHDKIYSEDKPCFGCQTEAANNLPSAEDLDKVAEEKEIAEKSTLRKVADFFRPGE